LSGDAVEELFLELLEGFSAPPGAEGAREDASSVSRVHGMDARPGPNGFGDPVAGVQA
jgi:hypothetical protein